MHVNAIWIDGPLPELQQLCARSWVANGHDYSLWAYESLVVPAGVRLRDAREVVPEPILRYAGGDHEGSPILHANLFRYQFLADRGGCAIDADTLCLKPFDLSQEFAISSEKDGHPNLALVNVPYAQSNFAMDCRATAASLLSTPTWGLFGPKLVAEKVKQWRLGSYVLPPKAFCPIAWWDVDHVFDKDPPDVSDALGVQLWQTVLSRERIDPSRGYPETSLWESWKRLYAPSEGD